MPVTASLIAAGIGGAQSAFGAYQYLEGRRLAKTAKRPEMEIPREMYNKLTTAQQMALEGMSEQERKQYIDNLQRVANFQMQEMGTRKAGLVGAAELGQTQADALTNMAVQSEQLRRQNQMYLGQTQSEMAGWKQQQFMANKMAPYMATVTAANAMQGSGLQNIMGGAGSAAKNIGAAGIYSGLDKPNTIGNMPTTPTASTSTQGAVINPLSNTQSAADIAASQQVPVDTSSWWTGTVGEISQSELDDITKQNPEMASWYGNFKTGWPNQDKIELVRKYEAIETKKEINQPLTTEEEAISYWYPKLVK